MPIDLRTPKPVAPAAPQPRAELPPALRSGNVPLAAGSVIQMASNDVRLTAEERSDLEKLGWKAGDPIPAPGDMAEKIRQLQEEATADANTVPDYINQLQPVTAPREINYDELPPEHQQAVQQMMIDGAELQKRLDAARQQQIEAPSSPDVNRAIEEIQTGTARQMDLNEPVPEMQTAAAVSTICDQCGHQNGKDIVPATDEDKLNFLVYMTAEDVRFKKEFIYLAGNVRLVFRSLTSAEMDLSLRQTAYDDTAGLVPTQYEYMRIKNNYDLIMSLESITIGKKTVPFDSAMSVLWDAPKPPAPPATVLRDLYPHMMEQYLNKDSLLRLAHLSFRRFLDLMRRLEANSMNADFWKGIELPS